MNPKSEAITGYSEEAKNVPLEKIWSFQIQEASPPAVLSRETRNGGLLALFKDRSIQQRTFNSC